MDLIDRGAVAQFCGCIAENSFIGRAVVEPAAFTIHYRDHVGCVIGDKLEQLVTMRKLSPDSLKLKVLVHRVEIEQQNEGCKAANPFSGISPAGSGGLGILAEVAQKDDSRSQRERDGYRETPKPPLPTIDLADSSRRFSRIQGSGIFKLTWHMA